MFERDHSRSRRGTQFSEAAPDERAINAAQRHHIGDRAERHDIEIAPDIGITRSLKPTFAAQFGAQANDEIKSQPRGTEIFIGKRTILAMRVDHSHGGRKLPRRLMMVNDDDIEAKAARRFDFPGVGNTAIHRHQ